MATVDDIYDDEREEEEAPVSLGSSRLDDGEMDITPMIDITFLLLIFFLVASKMDSEAAVDLPGARTGVGVVQKNAVILNVTDAGEHCNVVAADGTEFPPNDVEEQERRITEYIEGQLNATPPKYEILLRAEKNLKHREIARVAKAIGRASEEGNRLHIAVMEIH